MGDQPQRLAIDDASIDRLASSLVSSNSFRLKPFTGVNATSDGGGLEDVNRWIDDFEDMCAVNGWQNATKCQKFAAFLDGGARDFYREEIRGKDAANDWNQLKDAF